MMIEIGLLVDHPEAVEPLVALMEGEWPDWYNPRGASARADLSERAQRNGLPLGLVALDDGMAVGTCALTMSSGGLVTERSPWLGGLLVHPAYRRRGIGGQLLERARSEARRFGYKTLFALTAEAEPLFESRHWRVTDVILLGEQPHTIFSISTAS